MDCRPTPPWQVRLSVPDFGPGIAPDKLARLFVAFDRLGAEDTAVQGTGLGLALSKHLVEAMGGSIGVESTPGKGSTFWVAVAPGAPTPGRTAGRVAACRRAGETRRARTGDVRASAHRFSTSRTTLPT